MYSRKGTKIMAQDRVKSLKAKKSPASKKVKKTAAKATSLKRQSVKAVKRVTKTVEKTAKQATANAQKVQATAVEGVTNVYTLGTQNKPMEKLMNQGKNQFDKLSHDAAEIGRENVEAVIKSSTIFAKGLEDIMRTAMALAQDSAERQGKYFKEALGSKTLNEWTEVQNRIAQTNFEEFMSGATKITELSVKLLNDSAEPLNTQVTKGINKAGKSMAA